MLAGLLSFGVLTDAVRIGVVPTAVGPGVIGIESGLLAPGLIGPGLVQVTALAVLVQVQPGAGLKGPAGAVMPVGRGTVTVIGPLGAPPTFVTVTGTLLVMPSLKLGEGWPMLIVKSDLVQSANPTL